MTRESEVTETFHRFRNALFACDTEALELLLAQEYRGYTLPGNLEGCSRDGIMEAYLPGVASLDTWEATNLKVEVIGRIGVLTGVGHVAGKWQRDPWSHHFAFFDLYVEQEGSWQLLLSQVTPLEGLGPGKKGRPLPSLSGILPPFVLSHEGLGGGRTRLGPFFPE